LSSYKKDSEKSIKILKFYTELTKGLYVRSLAQDICRKISAKGFTYSIKRTKNREYNQENSKTLEEIFGQDYQNKIDFVSRPKLR